MRTLPGINRRLTALLTALLIGAALVLVGLGAAPANASPPRWEPADPRADLTVGLAANLNDPLVVLLDSRDVRIKSRADGGSAWTDLGAPPDATVASGRIRQLATAFGKVFASTESGVYRHVPPATWERIGEPVAHLVASRVGTVVRWPNGETEYIPYLYAIDGSGYVHRYAGQWVPIGYAGTGQPDLVEGGMYHRTKLYLLRGDHSAIAEWYGGGWTRISGPADAVVGGPWHVAMVPPGGTELLGYGGVPDRWAAPAAAADWADITLPPGGRWAVGFDTVYQVTGDGKALWGRRAPPQAGASAVEVNRSGRWMRLSAGPLRQVVVASGRGSDGTRDATALYADGTVSTFTWPETEPAVDRHIGWQGKVGEPLDARVLALRDWRGAASVGVFDGSLPPGVTVGIDPLGRVHYHGTPTSSGRFDFTLRVTDDTGAYRELVDHAIVCPCDVEPDLRHEPQVLNPAAAVAVVNCLDTGSLMRVWVRDSTAGTAWRIAADLPTARIDGRCDVPPPGTVVLVDLPAGHLVELSVQQLDTRTCRWDAEPLAPGCELFHRYYTGQPGAGGPTLRLPTA